MDTNTPLIINGMCVPVLKPSCSYRYLGIDFSPEGIVYEAPKITTLLDRLDRAPLKPFQRLYILRNFAIPTLQQKLVLGKAYRKSVGHLDGEVRRAVRKWLKLPKYTALSGLHASIRVGGLGVPHIASIVFSSKNARFAALSNSTDPVVRLASETQHVRKVYGIAFRLKYTSESQKAHWASKIGNNLDTKGIKGIEAVPAVNRCLYTPDCGGHMSGKDFVNSMKVRLGCLETPVRQSRGGRPVDTKCKCGGDKGASGQHIIQGCPVTHGLRVRRHVNIVKYIERTAKCDGRDIIREARVMTETGLCKPDLVLHYANRVIIVDVQVRAATDMRDLEMAHR